MKALRAFVWDLPYTPGRRIWDFFWIAVLPPLCFYFDPIVFGRAGSGGGGAFLFEFRTPAYLIWLATALASGSTMLWRLPAALGEIRAGIIAFGAMVAIALGIVMLPFSAIGMLVMGIGMLGLTPFVTAISLWRCARSSHCPADGRALFGGRWLWLGLGALILPVGTGLANAHVQRVCSAAVSDLLACRENRRQDAIAILSRYRVLFTPWQIVEACAAEHPPRCRVQLELDYERITGESLDVAISRFRD